MRVLAVHSRKSGSTYHRIEQPAAVVREAEPGVEVLLRPGLSSRTAPGPGGEPEIVDVDTESADVVVVQLPKTLQMLQCIRILKAKGVAVVVEMDDLLSAVPFGHAGHQALIRNGMARLALACAREADYVTASTPALLDEYAPDGRGVVVPNAIPRAIAELPPAYERDPEILTVGWTGNTHGHPYDLQEMGSGLQQALDRTRGRSRFAVLGQKWDIQGRLGLAQDPHEYPWMSDVGAYLARIGELFEVGIAPLRDDAFNRSKSWLKPMEYSARGVYCVRARIGEYDRLGLGVPARAPKDWAKWISAGLQDADRRREVATAARETVLAGHLTEHTAERWVAAWRTAVEIRARRRPAAVALAG